MRQCDVLVVGSGAAGLAAAARAIDNGLSVCIAEKSAYWGGTSAISGGALWLPCNAQIPQDRLDQARTYMAACIGESFDAGRVDAYLARVNQTVDFLARSGVQLKANTEYPDYRQDLPGAAMGGRTMDPMPYDGKRLGEHFHTLRDQLPFMKVIGRISLSNPEGRILSMRRKGWVKLLLGMMARYWLDVPWRLKTRRGSRLTMGSSLVAPLGAKVLNAGVMIDLEYRLSGIKKSDGENYISSFDTPNGPQTVSSRAIVLACGGFEHDEALRQTYLHEAAQRDHSASPKHNNTGDALHIAKSLGAATQGTENAWWAPSVRGPMGSDPDAVYVLFMERAFPGGVILNKRGERFANEAKSYNDFGLDMIADQERTGGSSDVWLLFDAGYRTRYMVGPLMAGSITPDKALPKGWLGRIFYRDETLEGLAKQIGLPPEKVVRSLCEFNTHAKNGDDPVFNRGDNGYDRYFGDPAFENPNVAPVEQAPFYAIRIVLGDLGTNGGLSTNTDGAVLDKQGQPISGLYAVGNTSASLMGNSYPGAGGTLGPAISFAIAAADDVARKLKSNRHQGG